MRRIVTITLAVLGAVVATLPSPAQLRTNPPSPNPNLPYLASTGWTRLVERMKKEKKPMPTGKGVWVAQIEPSVSGDPKKPVIKPDLAQVFAKPKAANEFTLNIPGQPAGDPSGHSTMVAQYYYGQHALATGISKVDMLEPGSEFIPKWLGIPKGEILKSDKLPKVSSHSYVESKSVPAVVRRLDEFIAANDHIAVVAVGLNEPTAPVAPLFGTSYNAIVAGLTDGKAAHGAVKEDDDGAGRIKPDLVIPTSVTSVAAPILASGVALLCEAVNHDAVATKPVVVKACLMASAHREFVTELVPAGWSNTDEKPLHPTLGAGQLDIDIAHLVMTAGRVKLDGETDGGLNGWSFETIEGENKTQVHVFDVPDEQETTTVSVALVWNRTFTDGKPVVPDLNLSLGKIDEKKEFIKHFDKSVSKVDNAEIIVCDQPLSPGRYGLRVTNVNGEKSDYGLAWHITTKPRPNLRRDPPQNPLANAEMASTQKYMIYTGALVIMAGVLMFFFRRQLRIA